MINRNKVKISINTKSEIVGQTLGTIEGKFRVRIMELNNSSDRAFVFSWENPPKKSLTVKPEDEIVVFGKPQNIEQFSKAALLN